MTQAVCRTAGDRPEGDDKHKDTTLGLGKIASGLEAGKAWADGKRHSIA